MTKKERVQAGAKLLDEQHPGWHNKIDIATLNIGSCFRCILGQLYGEFSEGASKLCLYHSEQFGFCLSSNEPPYRYKSLRERWVEEIRERREKDSQEDRDFLREV